MSDGSLINKWENATENERKGFIEYLCVEYPSPIAEALYKCKKEADKIKIGRYDSGTDPD